MAEGKREPNAPESVGTERAPDACAGMESERAPAPDLERVLDAPEIMELERILTAHAGSPESPFLAAIDGRCGSGKSTLAAALSARHGWSAIPMDAFFPRPFQRTPSRYAEPGGNVDRERFLEEVLIPLRTGKPVSYRVFDCRDMRLSREAVPVARTPVMIIEGSYSCHPALWNFYDFRVFLTIDAETQSARILRRNGAKRAELFARRWIPMEERYFKAFSVEERCDYVLRMSG